MDATYLAELASASRGFAAFADRREGEEWETNGRRYRRANGRTVRLGKKGGGSLRPAPDFRVEGLPDAPAPSPAPTAVPHETADGLAPGVYHGPARTLRQRIAGRLRKLALEWVPKIKSIPSMLPGVGATVAAAGGGVAAGGPLGLMLGSVVAGGALNKAMDRGAKRAKAARLAMARTPAERRWAAKRNQQVYFSEVGALTREMEAAFGDLSHRLRVHRFAWKQGKRGGRYWLPDGREDRPANRLYGAKAESAAKSAGDRGGEKAPRGGPRPGEEQRVARAKFEVARDAHAAAVAAKLPQDRIDWLRGRMEAAQKELEAKHPEAARKPAPQPAEGLNPFGWLSKQYGKLRERYGRTGAALTVAGMALPVPGTVVAAPLAAEAVLRARKFLGMSDRPAA